MVVIFDIFQVLNTFWGTQGSNGGQIGQQLTISQKIAGKISKFAYKKFDTYDATKNALIQIMPKMDVKTLVST